MHMTLPTDNGSIIAMVDSLFSAPSRPPTQTEVIEATLAAANRLDLLLLELAKKDPHDANIAEAQDFAQGILLNVAGYRRKINEPYVSCDCGGKCDSCVAARSDEHHDRKRDGVMA